MWTLFLFAYRTICECVRACTFYIQYSLAHTHMSLYMAHTYIRICAYTWLIHTYAYVLIHEVYICKALNLSWQVDIKILDQANFYLWKKGFFSDRFSTRSWKRIFNVVLRIPKKKRNCSLKGFWRQLKLTVLYWYLWSSLKTRKAMTRQRTNVAELMLLN